MSTLNSPAEPRSRSRSRFSDLLGAEWIKLRSLRSTYWVLGIGVLIVIGINVNSARSNAIRLANQPAVPEVPPPHGELKPEMVFDPMWTAFVDPAYQILMIMAACIGAIAIFGEYTTGLIRTTFAAVPARRSVVAAKATVLTALMLALGTLVSATSFGVTQWLLREHGGLSISDPGTLRAVAASALLAPLCALIGMALGALIRHAAGTIVATVVVLLLLPTLFWGETYRWVKEIANAMPLSAWEALVANPAIDRDLGKYPVSITEAWTVFAAWPLAAALIAVIAVHRRDL